jgi:hypothetical protein
MQQHLAEAEVAGIDPAEEWELEGVGAWAWDSDDSSEVFFGWYS